MTAYVMVIACDAGLCCVRVQWTALDQPPKGAIGSGASTAWLSTTPLATHLGIRTPAEVVIDPISQAYDQPTGKRGGVASKSSHMEGI